MLAMNKIANVDNPIMTYKTVLSSASRSESLRMAKYFIA
jgi:hypothetical protein